LRYYDSNNYADFSSGSRDSNQLRSIPIQLPLANFGRIRCFKLLVYFLFCILYFEIRKVGIDLIRRAQKLHLPDQVALDCLHNI